MPAMSRLSRPVFGRGATIFPLLRLVVFLLFALAQPATAATYNPTANAATASSFPWIDISTSGTLLTLADDVVSSRINIGFGFEFGSSTYTDLAVSSNGLVHFAAISTAEYANSAMPLDGKGNRSDMDAVLLPLWDDLLPPGGQVRYALTGTAPNRVFVVSWLAVPFYASPTTKATFQVQLHEQGAIVYRYQAVGGGGNSATIGLEVNDTDFVQHSVNKPVLSDGTTILWSRATPVASYAYLFNERIWNGTSGEVRDASSGMHGTAGGLVGKATTSSATPAIAGPVGTCGYGEFTRSDKDHVLLPGTLPNFHGTTFTLTAWVRTSNPGTTQQRVFVDDENRTGWGVSLGDAGSGTLRFFSRAAGLFLDTAGVITANTWYFFALSVDATTRQVVLTIYSSTGLVLSSVSTTYPSNLPGIGADPGRTTIGGNSNTALDKTSTVGYSGQIDEVRVFNRKLMPSEHHLVRQMVSTCPAYLVASYNFDETGYTGATGELADNAGYGGGPFNGQGQGTTKPGSATASPARSTNPGTCRYATLPGPPDNGGNFKVIKLPLTTDLGAQTTVSFWMYWDGTDSVMPVGFEVHDLWLYNGHFGFNTRNSDIYGVSSAGLANSWQHVVAVFTNGNVASNQLWINGVQQTLTQRLGAPEPMRAYVAPQLYLGGQGAVGGYRFTGRLDQVRVYNGAVTPADVAALYAEVPSTCAPPPLHHLAISHASGTGSTCAPSTLTVRACQDAACSTLYTGGLSGSLSASGGTVVWPDGNAFSIASGSSSATVRMQATTTTPALLGATASSPAATNATTCDFGSPSCTFTAASSALVVTVPNHVAETSAAVTVSASGSCGTSLASSTRNINFRCSYADPASGTRAVRLTGGALNSAKNAASACDGTGRTVSLSFNASGVASTNLLYADAGQVRLSATYTGSAATSDTGLSMTGDALFIAAPDHFTIDGVTAGPIRAGASFSATLTARNAAGATTPNHGNESVPQRASLGWVRLQPTGSGAANGQFTGTELRSFSAGAVTASNLAWTEVGRGNLVALGANSSGYMGTGLKVFGSSAAGGARDCAPEGGSCALPGGTTATVYYGAPGGWAAKTAQSGTVACNNSNFGNPLVGTVKRCYYVATAATNGSVGDFIPSSFSTAATNACGAFTYAGQPATVTVTARNLAGNPTVNFNGTATTTPTFAQTVTLSDGNALGLGTLSGGSIAASAFSAGVGSAQVSYAFTNKATAPQSLLLRAANGSSGSSVISSAGGTEATLALRSGRLRLSNAFGKAGAALLVPAVTEYWSGNAWLLNSADSCTALAGASVALSNLRGATGAASSATTSAGALAISSGSGSITLATPNPAANTLSLNLAVNLGSTSADQSCNAAHPATTGAALPWLRAQNGSCATTADRDPAARASFGIYIPEFRKTVHAREIF